MSKSIHTTYSKLKNLSKREIDEQTTEPESILNILAKKSALKKMVKRERKNKKR